MKLAVVSGVSTRSRWTSIVPFAVRRKARGVKIETPARGSNGAIASR